jgi:hypothetical protein
MWLCIREVAARELGRVNLYVFTLGGEVDLASWRRQIYMSLLRDADPSSRVGGSSAMCLCSCSSGNDAPDLEVSDSICLCFQVWMASRRGANLYVFASAMLILNLEASESICLCSSDS